MPIFLHPHSEVPDILDPIKPYHYWLLIKWTLFQPTRIEYYLYSADSNLYKTRGRIDLWLHTLRLPAYRNLYLLCVVLTFSLFLLGHVIPTAIFHIDTWSNILWKLIILTSPILIIFLASLFNINGSVVGGVKFVVASSIAISIALGGWNLARERIGRFRSPTAVIIKSTYVGSPASEVGLQTGDMILAINGQSVTKFEEVQAMTDAHVQNYPNEPLILSIQRNGQKLTISLIPRINPPPPQGEMGITMENVYPTNPKDIEFYLFCFIAGVAIGIVGDVVVTTGFGLVMGLVGGFIMVFVTRGNLTLPLFTIIGSSRLLIVEWVSARLLSRSTRDPFAVLAKHPITWDESFIAPWSGIDRILFNCLALDYDRGLCEAARIAMNPFQRWVVQRTLSDFIISQTDSLVLLYRIAQLPELEISLFIPYDPDDISHTSTIRTLLLREIGQGYVILTNYYGRDLGEYFIRGITIKGRRMTPSLISKFSDILSLLFEFRNYPGAMEIIWSRLSDPLEIAYDVSGVQITRIYTSIHEGIRNNL